MFQVCTYGRTNKAHEQGVICIDVGANSLVYGVAGGATAHHPLRVKQTPCPDQVQILEQLRVVLLRLAQVVTDHVQGHFR